MPKYIVPNDFAAPIRRPPGSIVTLINQSATDIFFDADANRMLNTIPGSTPQDGSKLVAGSQLPYYCFPQKGVIWVRAVTYTTIEVQP